MYFIFKKFDDELLYDILQYVIDDFYDVSNISIINNIIEYSFNNRGYVNPFYIEKLNNFEQSIKDKDGKIIDNIDIVYNIIKKIDDDRTRLTNDYNLRKENEMSKRPGHVEYFTKIALSELNSIDYFNNINIYPSMILRVSLFNEVYDPGFRNNRRNIKNEIIKSISSDECIGRYLNALGFNNYKYEVDECRNIGWGDFSDTFDIKVKFKNI